MHTEHILIVEDDDVVAALLAGHLEKAGYQVSRSADGAGLLALVKEMKPTAIILDAQLPKADGFQLCRDLRPKFAGPIIMLTARDDDFDELLGLELGADDYIRKPANSRIVLAHLRACLRRNTLTEAEGEQVLVVGPLSIDRQSRTAKFKRKELLLTTAEYDLLLVLAEHAGEVLSRDDIFRLTRGLEYDGLDRSIDMRISRLRKLLGDDPDNPRIIKTVRGKGYLFSFQS